MNEDVLKTKQVTVNIGGFSNRLMAEQEAREFKRDTVFTRRSGMFPNPVDFDIQVEPVESLAQEWPEAASPLNQFYVKLTLKITGLESHVDDWIAKLQSKVEIFHPEGTRTPGRMGERAEHLEATGRQVAPKAEKESSRKKGQPKVLDQA